MKTTVKEPAELIDFLAAAIDSASKSTIKKMIRNGAISVGGRVTYKGNLLLQIGDVVEVNPKEDRKRREISKKMKSLPYPVVYEDDYLLIVNKPAGIPTSGNANSGGNNLYSICKRFYREKEDNPSRLFLAYRLEKEASGLVVLTKQESLKNKLKASWKDSEQRYAALVEGGINPDRGTLTDHLKVFSNGKVLVQAKPDGDSEEAILTYKVLKTYVDTSLIELRPKTYIKRQIAVQLANAGCAIVGDLKRAKNPKVSETQALVHFYVSFTHPHTKAPIVASIPYPKFFQRLGKKGITPKKIQRKK